MKLLKLIIDANIIMAALIRNSMVRKMIINLPFEFHSPVFVFEEINNHIEDISKKNSLTVEENLEVLNILSKYIYSIDYRFYKGKLQEVDRIRTHRSKRYSLYCVGFVPSK
ncbi:MAG: PIN domain-containing protein [Methanosarcinales archaeon]